MTTEVPSTVTTGNRDDRRHDPASREGSEYAELSRRVRQAGLMRQRPGYYTVKIGVNLFLFVAGWAAFVLVGRSWWQMLMAAFLAVMFTQIAFVGHDAGHHQIARSKRVNEWLGRLHGNLLVGLGYGWWVSKHNRHHAHPNQVERDPDIGNGAIAFTADPTRSRRRFIGFLTRRQAWFFFPILLLEGVNLHVASARTFFGRTRRRGSRWMKAVEGGLLLVHFGGYLALVFWVLSPLQAVCFIVIQQGLFGVYMGCSFAPNHKGMPVFGADEKIDFLRRQVLTSRNIRGGRTTDWLLGGLNYQIEHHLFPSMPRPNLRRAQAHVRTFCALHDLAYHETGLWRSYAQVLHHLNTVGGPLRPDLEY